jgi:hypothetical protein
VGATTWGVPGAPRSLTATPQVHGVSLRWQPPIAFGGTPVTGYAIYRSQHGPETWLATIGNVSAYQDTSAAGGARYFYRVAAINAVGAGPRGNEVSARPYNVLLQTGPIPLPPGGPLATITVCNAGSSQGCQVPGSAFFCVEASVAGGPAIPLACATGDTVPAPAKALLEGMSPIQVALPPSQPFASTPSLSLAYLHERSRLAPWDTKPLCDPVVASQAGVLWWIAAGPDTALEVRITGTDPMGNPVNIVQSIPYVGQLAAAAQATRGLIPCG